jgi:hypothetical protein
MEHTGGMVALIPRAEDATALAVSGGETPDALRLTLIYLGDDVTGWTARQRAQVVASAAFCAIDIPPVEARVFGHAVFNPDGAEEHWPCCVYLVGESPMIGPLQQLLVEYAAEEQHAPFTAHMTAGYGIPFARLAYTGPVVFDRLRVALADQVLDFPLGDPAQIKKLVAELETKGKMPPGLAGRFKKKGGTSAPADAGINNIGDLAKAIKGFAKIPDADKPARRAQLTAAAKRLNATKMLSGLPEDAQKSIYDAAWLEHKVASPDPRAEKLREYWAHGEGVKKWRPGTPGDFMRLVRHLRKYVQNPHILKGLAANIHHMATGTWPGPHAHDHKAALDWLDDGAPLEAKMLDLGDLREVLEIAQAALTDALAGEDETNLVGDGEEPSDGPTEEDATEQALADDVTWDLEPDGTLTSDDVTAPGDESLAALFAALRQTRETVSL